MLIPHSLIWSTTYTGLVLRNIHASKPVNYLISLWYCNAPLLIAVLPYLVFDWYPSGLAIHVPQNSTRIYGGNPGDHPCRKFPHEIPAEIQGKRRGIFYVDISTSFPFWIPGDISGWKFPSRFPQKFQNAIYWHRKGPSGVKISHWWLDVILLWIEMLTGLG